MFMSHGKQPCLLKRIRMATKSLKLCFEISLYSGSERRHHGGLIPEGTAYGAAYCLASLTSRG
jgi:hypothetical protein